ncbi:MAG: hypothetical protein COA45_06275 [Zetaproteobacteria bacterium]|nr:MAG: hypothetical protein COA45_06275 [Zetaproteobacteria bacterium]
MDMNKEKNIKYLESIDDVPKCWDIHDDGDLFTTFSLTLKSKLRHPTYPETITVTKKELESALNFFTKKANKFNEKILKYSTQDTPERTRSNKESAQFLHDSNRRNSLERAKSIIQKTLNLSEVMFEI